MFCCCYVFFFFFKQKTAYDMRISDWSSDVCSSDLVAVDSRPRRVAYKESIRKSVRQHGRHKKQSGGHGQFGDVIIEVSPLARGEGFVFSEKKIGRASCRERVCQYV